MIADSIIEVWFTAASGVIAGLIALFLGSIAKRFPRAFSSPVFHSDKAILAERLLAAFCSGALLTFAQVLYANWTHK